MRKQKALIFALFAMLPSLGIAHAQTSPVSGEYKAFTYKATLGCGGLTTEQGGVPDCYDVNDNWSRHTWSQTLGKYVPAPESSMTVAGLPTCSDSFSKNAIAVVTDSTNACVAGNTLTGGGTFVCPVFCNGTSWAIMGAAGAGGSGVQTIGAGTGINITGTTSSPIININPPVAASIGGTGVNSPAAHSVPITEGSSAFSLLTGTANLPLVGNGALVDPSFQQLSLTEGVAGILPVANGGRQCGSPTTVASLPGSPTQGEICTVTDSANSCTSGAAVTGSGTNICVVFYNGSAWQMVGTASGSTGMTNPMTTLGDIIYENATPAPARLAGSTSASQAVLTQTGNGTISAAPAWSTTINSSMLSGTTTGLVFVMGAVTNSQVLYYPMPISITFPATFGSGNVYASCSTNPSESDAYTLKSGGTSLATITVSTSCGLTFSTLAGSHVAAAGEKVEMDAPATASGNVSFSIQVTR